MPIDCISEVERREKKQELKDQTIQNIHNEEMKEGRGASKGQETYQRCRRRHRIMQSPRIEKT